MDIDILCIKKENQRPGQSIKVLLKEVIQLPVSVVCRDYTNVLMASRACWMGSDPALVRLGSGCARFSRIHWLHQWDVGRTGDLRRYILYRAYRLLLSPLNYSEPSS